MSPVRYTDTIGGGGGSGDCLTDEFSIGIIIADTIPAINDAASFAFGVAFSDTLSAPTDTLSLGFSSPDTIPTQTDARSATATWIEGATTAAQVGSWTNPTNAQGLRDAINSTLTDGVANSNAGTLTLDPYPDPPADLTSWTISSVKFRVFAVGTNFSVATTSRLHLEYSQSGGAFSTLESISANFDNSAAGNPRVFDITLSIGGNWAIVNTLKFRFRYVAALISETATINVDAVELEVVATKASF